jgi:hypothetical protein
MFQSIFIHTFPIQTFHIQCLRLTQPPEHKISTHAAIFQPVRMVPQQETVFGSNYTDRPFEPGSMFCSGPD